MNQKESAAPVSIPPSSLGASSATDTEQAAADLLCLCDEIEARIAEDRYIYRPYSVMSILVKDVRTLLTAARQRRSTMTEYVHLVGAEQVQSAGQNMRAAAEEMQRAALTIDSALERHRQFLDTWLQQFEQILTDNKP